MCHRYLKGLRFDPIERAVATPDLNRLERRDRAVALGVPGAERA